MEFACAVSNLTVWQIDWLADYINYIAYIVTLLGPGSEAAGGPVEIVLFPYYYLYSSATYNGKFRNEWSKMTKFNIEPQTTQPISHSKSQVIISKALAP